MINPDTTKALPQYLRKFGDAIILAMKSRKQMEENQKTMLLSETEIIEKLDTGIKEHLKWLHDRVRLSIENLTK